MNNVSGSGSPYGTSAANPTQNMGTANKQTQKDGCKTNGILKEIDVIFSGKVSARDGIEFTNVTALKTVRCAMGSIKAMDSFLNDVNARDGVKLLYTIAGGVSVSMGEIYIENTNPEIAIFQQLTARDTITLQNISVKNKVKTSMGEVIAKNCILNTVKARDGIRLVNTSANSCKVSMGNLSISAVQKLLYQKLFARDNIDLKNIVAGKVGSKTGYVRAEDCSLKEIESREELSLVRSTCGSANLSVLEGNKGVLTLFDSNIEGDLVVEVIKDDASASTSNMWGGSNISASNGSTCSIISGKTFKIITSSIDKFNCTFMQNGSTGTVNGIPHKFEGGRFISLAPVEKKSKVSDEVEIEIHGNGFLKGNIIFKGCKGKVTITADAKVAGGN